MSHERIDVLPRDSGHSRQSLLTYLAGMLAGVSPAVLCDGTKSAGQPGLAGMQKATGQIRLDIRVPRQHGLEQRGQ